MDVKTQKEKNENNKKKLEDNAIEGGTSRNRSINTEEINKITALLKPENEAHLKKYKTFSCRKKERLKALFFSFPLNL